MFDVQFPVVDQPAVDEVDPHDPLGRSGDATELRQIAFRHRHRRIEEAPRRLANRADERTLPRRALRRVRTTVRCRGMAVIVLGTQPWLGETRNRHGASERQAKPNTESLNPHERLP